LSSSTLLVKEGSTVQPKIKIAKSFKFVAPKLNDSWRPIVCYFAVLIVSATSRASAFFFGMQRQQPTSQQEEQHSIITINNNNPRLLLQLPIASEIL
jgi:hypothetical protein